MSSKVPKDIAPFGKIELMNQAALPRKCKSMVSSTILFLFSTKELSMAAQYILPDSY